jgi:diguanylate cyclase (GGDEF)-like protein
MEPFDLTGEELLEIVNKEISCDKIFQIVRIVDPITKKVISCEDNKVVEGEEPCFCMWENNEVCENCISMRASIDGESFVKLKNKNQTLQLVIATPIVIKNRKLVVELIKDVTKSNFIFGDIMNDANEVKVALKEANLVAVTDELTGIYNKRYIMEKLPFELLSEQIGKQQVAIVMADLDFFKRVNDTYGHLAGDSVLKSFATLMHQNLRQEHDWVARFGGEEFIVFLKGKNRQHLISIVERMRKSIENNVFSYEGNDIQLTASFGICFIDGSTKRDYNDVVQVADKMLYKAKNEGRNCIRFE